MSGINLSADSMRDILATAILNQISKDERDNLIKGALDYLMKEQEKGNGWNSKKISPLMESFNSATTQICREIAIDYIKNDIDITNKIKELIREAFVKVFEKNKEEVVDKIANNMSEVIAKISRDYY